MNAADLYAGFNALKRDLAVVPQKDLLYDSLTVEEALTFTARLRLPPDPTSTTHQSQRLAAHCRWYGRDGRSSADG